jgi:hypothetical protein
MKETCMKRILFLIIMILVLSVTGGTSYARIVVSDVWKEKSYQGPAKKVVVFCVMHDAVNRILFEDEFVRQLKARGVNAMPGYVIIAPDKFVEKDVAFTKMRALGADVVLSTRLIDKVTAKAPVPEPASQGSSDKPGFYDYVYDPRTRGDNEPAYLESNLLDLKAEQRVWTARSKTKVEGISKEVIADYIELMLDKLASDKMIK